MFCYNCGKKIDLENAKYCSYCGTKLDGSGTNYKEIVNKWINKIKNFIKKIKKKIKSFNKEKIKEAEIVSDKESNLNIMYAIMSYLGPLIIIPFIMKKDNKYVYFHIKEGFSLLICWVFYFILRYVLSFVVISKKMTLSSGLKVIKYIVPSWVNYVNLILGLLLFILMCIGVYNALTSKNKRLPIYKIII